MLENVYKSLLCLSQVIAMLESQIERFFNPFIVEEGAAGGGTLTPFVAQLLLIGRRRVLSEEEGIPRLVTMFCLVMTRRAVGVQVDPSETETLKGMYLSNG